MLEFVFKTVLYLLAQQRDIVPLRDLRIDAILSEQCPRDDVQIVAPIVPLTGRKEGAIQIATIVIDRSTARVPASQRNARPAQLRYVRLAKRILMATDHDARIVGPQHQHMMVLHIVVIVDPVFQRQIGEHIVRLRYEHRLLDRRRLLLGC